jgi:type II secretory pathway predicted ATPase ExeA
MVLVGRESQLGVLGARLLSLAELRIDLEPWQAADTGGFLQQALAAAGGKNGIFTPAAVARLHQLSGGVPRRVKQLAELCLLAGAGAGAFSIDTAMVESVFRELGVVTPSAALA